MKKSLICSFILLQISFNLFSVCHKVGEVSSSSDSSEIGIYDNLLFVHNENNQISIFEISIPAFPVQISTIEITVDLFRSYFLNDTAYFLVDNNRMFIVDISNPFNPIILNEYNTVESGREISINENTAYIIESTYQMDYIEVVNISNLSDPQYITHFEISGSGNSIIITNDIAYIGTTSGLFVYDISNPANINEINWLDTGQTFSLLLQNGNLIFRGSAGLHIIDISDPLNINILSINDEIFFSHGRIEGNYLYCSVGKKLHVVDISDIYSTYVLSTYVSYKACSEIEIKDGYVFISSGLHDIEIIDVSEPENINLVSYQNIESDMIEKSPDNQFLLVYGDHSDGLRFFEMSDPLNPNYLYSHIIQNYPTDCYYIYIDSEFACSNFGTTLYTYDLSDMTTLSVASTTSLNYAVAKGIARKDDFLYVGTSDDVIMIFDISDINNLLNVANIDVQTYICDLEIRNSNLYFTNIDGLKIFDISDPLVPVELGFWDSSNRAEQFTISDNYAYIADYDGGIKVVDISNATNPYLVDTIVLHNSSKLISKPIIRNDKLFVSDRNWNEISVYTLGDPAHPDHLFSYNWDHFSCDFEIIDNYVFSANGYNNYNFGFSQLDFSEFLTNIETNEIPNSFSGIYLNNFPNPFNPSTTIVFSIQNESEIEISVFNIKGQRIKTLVKDGYLKGSHSIIWHGDDDNGQSVSSGIYYYKLNVNGKTKAVKKCLLLK